MSDWDAATYSRISDPQLAWGREVAARLAPRAGERILDLGCGPGQLTRELAATPGVIVVGLDRSAAMLAQAAAAWGQTPASKPYSLRGFVRGDGAALPFAGVFDAVFSAATFHWIPDHDRLFSCINLALKPGGRLVAQAGGAGNLDRLYGRTRKMLASPTYAGGLARGSDPRTDLCHFEGVGDTEERLRRAGFGAIDVSLVSAPVTFDTPDAYAEFVATVCLRHQLDLLAASDRGRFLRHLTDDALADDPPLTLDYWRLNIAARKGSA